MECWGYSLLEITLSKKPCKNPFIGIWREKEFQDRRFRRNEASQQYLEYSVLKATIKNCCKIVNFTQPEDNLEEQETEDTTDREIVGKWERLLAGGLSPETYGFTDYSASDEGFITFETITESIIVSELTADEDGEEEKEDDEDISIEDVQPAVLSPIEALAAIRKLDRYLRSSDDNLDRYVKKCCIR